MLDVCSQPPVPWPLQLALRNPNECFMLANPRGAVSLGLKELLSILQRELRGRHPVIHWIIFRHLLVYSPTEDSDQL